MLIILAISPEVVPLSYSFQKFSAPVNQCSSSPENCQEPKFNFTESAIFQAVCLNFHKEKERIKSGDFLGKKYYR